MDADDFKGHQGFTGRKRACRVSIASLWGLRGHWGIGSQAPPLDHSSDLL